MLLIIIKFYAKLFQCVNNQRFWEHGQSRGEASRKIFGTCGSRNWTSQDMGYCVPFFQIKCRCRGEDTENEFPQNRCPNFVYLIATLLLIIVEVHIASKHILSILQRFLLLMISHLFRGFTNIIPGYIPYQNVSLASPYHNSELQLLP